MSNSTMREATDVVVVLTTFPDAMVAQQVVTTLLHERLIACATLLPQATSMYMWQGTLTTDTEVQALLKTPKLLATQVGMRLQSLHPYTTPEIVVMDVIGGLAAYLDWVGASTHL